MYRFRKFARKHRAALATAVAIAASLILGTTASTWQAVRATTAEAQANANATQAQEKAQEATTQRDEAQRQRDEVKALNEKLAAKEQQLQRTLYAAHMNLAARLGKRLPFAAVPKLFHDDANPINSVAWSPDQRLLASGCLSGWVKVWDPRTGAEVSSFQAQKKFVRSLAVSPDSRILATGGEDDTVKLWDLTRPDLPIREPIREFRTGPGTTMQQVLEFSPDGRQLATADSGRKVRLWNVADGTEVFFPDHLVITGGLAFYARRAGSSSRWTRTML